MVGGEAVMRNINCSRFLARCHFHFKHLKHGCCFSLPVWVVNRPFSLKPSFISLLYDRWIQQQKTSLGNWRKRWWWKLSCRAQLSDKSLSSDPPLRSQVVGLLKIRSETVSCEAGWCQIMMHKIMETLNLIKTYLEMKTFYTRDKLLVTWHAPFGPFQADAGLLWGLTCWIWFGECCMNENKMCCKFSIGGSIFSVQWKLWHYRITPSLFIKFFCL